MEVSRGDFLHHRQAGWAAVLEDVLLLGAAARVNGREGLTGQEKGGNPVPVSPGGI